MLLFYRPQGLGLFLVLVFLVTNRDHLLVVAFVSGFLDPFGLELLFFLMDEFVIFFLFMFELIPEEVDFVFELEEFGLEAFFFLNEDRKFFV